jgi:hypothetical protein
MHIFEANFHKESTADLLHLLEWAKQSCAEPRPTRRSESTETLQRGRKQFRMLPVQIG